MGDQKSIYHEFQSWPATDWLLAKLLIVYKLQSLHLLDEYKQSYAMELL